MLRRMARSRSAFPGAPASAVQTAVADIIRGTVQVHRTRAPEQTGGWNQVGAAGAWV